MSVNRLRNPEQFDIYCTLQRVLLRGKDAQAFRSAEKTNRKQRRRQKEKLIFQKIQYEAVKHIRTIQTGCNGKHCLS
jgi:hypothetical protein